MKKNLAIAVDLGASNLRTAIIDQTGKILRSARSRTPNTKSGKLITETIIVLINHLLEDTDKKRIKGIGIGSIGPIDFKKGEIRNTPNLKAKTINLVKPLEKYFALPVKLYNDCTAAVWGEKHFGAGKKSKNLVYLTISSGIGAGVIVDNHLLIGHSRNAAEVGHFIIDTKYKMACGCKKGNGHWEAMCSGNNLPRFFKRWLNFCNKACNEDGPRCSYSQRLQRGLQRGPSSLQILKKQKIRTSADIFELADKKNKNVLNFLKELGQLNGHGISNIIVAYNPEIITIGGAVFLNNQKHILPYLKKNVDKYLKLPKIMATPLKGDIVLLGAAALLFFNSKN